MIKPSNSTFATIGEMTRSALPGARILLFGSQARGQADADSDYDILVITQQLLDMKSKFALRTRIRKRLLGKGIRCDVLIQSEREAERKKELPGHVIRSVLRDGVPL